MSHVLHQLAAVRFTPCWLSLSSRRRRHLNATTQQKIAQTAGSMPKINGEKLRATVIPLQPLKEQVRIADILNKVDAIRRKRQEAIALTESLLRSMFLEPFGDPVKNSKAWPSVKVADVGDVQQDGPARGHGRRGSIGAPQDAKAWIDVP